MRFFNLTPELRESLDEVALQLLELYDAEIIELIPPDLNNTDLWGDLNTHHPELGQKVANCLTLYRDTEGGEVALSELAHNLAPVMADLKSRCSQFIKKKQLETEAKRLEEELSKPLGILKLDSTIIAVLYPHAQERFNNWKEELNKEVPELAALTVEQIRADINDHWDDNDKIWAAKYEETIVEWLSKCIDRGGDGLKSVAYASWVIHSKNRLAGLLRDAYQQKRIKAENERKKKEWDERWHLAHRALNTPAGDAKEYLTGEEYEDYLKSINGAVLAYMEKEEAYKDDSRSADYRHSLWKINYKKEEERRKIAAKIEDEQTRNDAQAQAQGFRARLNQGLKEVEKLLSTRKKDPEVFFSNWCSNNGEKRYLGERFTDILASDNFRDRNWIEGYSQPAEDRLRQSIPGEFRNFILMKPTVDFFLLPSADEYGDYGVPCLDIHFDVFAVVTIEVLAQANDKVFNGYRFNFLTDLQEPKLLGFYQIVITPREPTFWQSIPLTILYALLDGNRQKAPSTTIIHRAKEETIYKVKKFDDDICEIPISVERCCRSWGSIDKMKELGIIDERTSEILETPQPDEWPEALRPISVNKKGGKSRKAKVLELFSQGKRPSDASVKSLGLKPESAFRYYQDWKKSSQ